MAPSFAALERKSIKSEFAYDESPVIILVTSILLVLTTIFVTLRCCVRIFIQKKFTPDDYIIVFSQVCFAALAAVSFVDVKYGAGKHVLYLSLHNLENLHKVLLVRCFLAFWLPNITLRCLEELRD